jgi:CRP-like cAMP-binding protein
MNEVLGRVYQPGENIVCEGDVGECMYVIQKGEAEVLRDVDGVPTPVDRMGEGDIFGEIAIVEQTVRSSTVRALTEVHALTIDRRTFLSRVREDPTLALNILRVMAGRVRRLDTEIARLRQQSARSAAG